MIEYSLEIQKTDSELFGLTQDYERRLEWDPFPESYEFLNGDKVNKGLQLLVRDKAGRKMTVEYVSFLPPRVAAIKMIDGPWYIKSFAGSWSFIKISSKKTKVIFKYNIVGHPSIMTLAVRQIFKYNVKKRLKALKQYAESKI